MNYNIDNNFEATHSPFQEPLNLFGQPSRGFPDFLSLVCMVEQGTFCLNVRFWYQKYILAFYDLCLQILKVQETPCAMEYSFECLVVYLTFLRNRKLRNRKVWYRPALKARSLMHSYQCIIFVFALATPKAAHLSVTSTLSLPFKDILCPLLLSIVFHAGKLTGIREGPSQRQPFTSH